LLACATALRICADLMRNAIISACLICVLTCLAASAARFPNAVERKIQLSGPVSIAIAQAFGLPVSQSSSASLRLGRGTAWAIYLLKQDTQPPLLNDNNGSPPRSNTLAFSPTPTPSIAISPYWLDLGTRGPDPRPGYYTFSSPLISEKLDSDDRWAGVIRSFKKDAHWNSASYPQLERCFTFEDGRQFCIQILSSNDDDTKTRGHIVQITVGPVAAAR
jgi:hypothetical protein